MQLDHSTTITFHDRRGSRSVVKKLVVQCGFELFRFQYTAKYDQTEAPGMMWMVFFFFFVFAKREVRANVLDTKGTSPSDGRSWRLLSKDCAWTALWLSPSVQKTSSERVILFPLQTLHSSRHTCRLTVTIETLEQKALTTPPDYGCFFGGHDPITHAHRAR